MTMEQATLRGQVIGVRMLSDVLGNGGTRGHLPVPGLAWVSNHSKRLRTLRREMSEPNV